MALNKIISKIKANKEAIEILGMEINTKTGEYTNE